MSDDGGPTPAAGEDVPDQTAPDGATGPVPDDALLDHALFGGRYVLGDLLGVGGTASVFAAEDIGADPTPSEDRPVMPAGEHAPPSALRSPDTSSPPGRPVALKILHPHLSADAASRDAFLAEARAAQELRHPNIAAVRASGVQEAAGVVLAWIALDLVDGGSVGERVESTGPLPPSEAAAVLDGVLAALAVAHGVRLVHRDVSPANVLLHGARPGEALRAEHVRLVDFGLADAAGRTAVGRGVLRAGEDTLRDGPGPDGSAVTVVLGAAQGRTVAAAGAGIRAGGGEAGAARTVVGNPQFMSPEQAQGRPVRPAGDLYQAGALLYYLLTGRPPYPRGTAAQVLDAHVSAPPPVPSALVPGARVFDRVVTRAMHKTPVRRFRDAGEMRAALAEAVERMGPAGGVAPGSGGAADAGGPAGAGGETGVREHVVGGDVVTDDSPHDADAASAGAAGNATGAGPRRAGDLEYLAPVPESQQVSAAVPRDGVVGVGVVVGGLLVAGLAIWAAVFAPGLPQAATTPSPSASVLASTPAPSRAASPSPSSSSEPSPSPSAPATASPPATPSPSATPISTGAPSPPARARVRVPVLDGTLVAAQAALRDAELVLGDVARADSPEPAGTVLRQRPAAGRFVSPGAEVDVTAASGRNVVPAVAGMTVGAAVAEVESAGFEAVLEHPDVPPTAPASGTTPIPGKPLRLGVAVTILVGEPGPTPSTSPS